MLARIRDNHYVYLEQVTQGSEETLVNYFSVRDPRSYHLSGDWDGWYRRYSVKYKRLALPFLNELKLCCEKEDIPLEVIDDRGAPKFPAPQSEQITSTLLDGVTLEDFQVRSLQTCCNNEIGIVSATTGSGKTELMCGLVLMFRCPTVIITEQTVVLEQIVKRLQMRNVVHNNDIGMFCHGYLPDGNLVMVGSIQSLSSPPKLNEDEVKVTSKEAIRQARQWIESHNECLSAILPQQLVNALYDNPSGVNMLSGIYLEKLRTYCELIKFDRLKKSFKTRLIHAKQIQEQVSKCDMMLVDEADLATGKQYATMFRSYFHGRRRYGFSGTPFDSKKPVQALLLKEHLGSIIFKADRREVEDAGRIIPIKFYMIAVGEDGDKEDCRAYDIAMKEEMVENDTFHSLVVKIVSAFPKDGTLILVDTSPIEQLGKRLEELIPGSKFIFGKTGRKERHRYIKMFEDRELTCLIGSKILKRGFDLNGGVENLVIIGGGGMWSDFEQKVGRAVRLNKRGWANVFGFYFLNNKYLYKHSRESLKAIVNIGYKTKVVIGGMEIDGEKFVKSRFRIPKAKG